MPERHKKLGSLKDALEEIAAAGDTARLQLHLLLMSVRERKGDLSVSLENLERDLDRGIEQAVQTATTKTRALTKNLKDLLKHVGSAPQGMSVQSIMTPEVRACAEHEPLHRAAQIMWDLDCGVVPVVDGAGKLCGVITDRDICMAAYTKGLPLGAIRVGEVMSRQLYSCRPSDTLERAASAMAEHQVRRLPVTDADGRPIGMLSLSDLANNAQGLSIDDVQRVVFQLLRAVSKRRRSSSAPSERQAAA
jgi:CBS domain-containing protein